MKKTFKVVMLPTEKAPIALNQDKLYLTQSELEYIKDEKIGTRPQHLYILSDEKIKEGDWVYRYYHNDIFKADSFLIHLIERGSTEICKKIIATTDKSLNGKSDSGLQMCLCGTWQMDNKGYPKCKGNCHTLDIPESFIQAYIKAYNEGKPIVEVDLEMYEHIIGNQGSMAFPNFETELRIKTRPDNTIIVHQSKMYTRDEVENLIDKLHGDMADRLVSGFTTLKEWKENNL